MPTPASRTKWILVVALIMVLIGVLGPRLHAWCQAWRTLPSAQFHQYLGTQKGFFVGIGIGLVVVGAAATLARRKDRI